MSEALLLQSPVMPSRPWQVPSRGHAQARLGGALPHARHEVAGRLRDQWSSGGYLRAKKPPVSHSDKGACQVEAQP